MISSPPPGSGAILASILGVMDAYQPGPRDLHRPLMWHRYISAHIYTIYTFYSIFTQYLHTIYVDICRFVEAAKFGYAGRTEMGDWHSPEIRQMMEDMIRCGHQEEGR